MNAFIALGVVCFSIAIVTGLIAGIFKIFIFRDFKMDEAWFDFGPSIKHLNFKLRKENGKDFLLNFSIHFLVTQLTYLL